MTALPIRKPGSRAMEAVAWAGLLYGVLWFGWTARAGTVGLRPDAVYAAAAGWGWLSPETLAAYAPAIGTIIGNAIYIYIHRRAPGKKARKRKPRTKADAPPAA